MAIFNNHVSLHDGMIRWEKTHNNLLQKWPSKKRWVYVLGLHPHDDGRDWWLAKNEHETKGKKTSLTKNGLKTF